MPFGIRIIWELGILQCEVIVTLWDVHVGILECEVIKCITTSKFIHVLSKELLWIDLDSKVLETH